MSTKAEEFQFRFLGMKWRFLKHYLEKDRFLPPLTLDAASLAPNVPSSHQCMVDTYCREMGIQQNSINAPEKPAPIEIQKNEQHSQMIPGSLMEKSIMSTDVVSFHPATHLCSSLLIEVPETSAAEDEDSLRHQQETEEQREILLALKNIELFGAKHAIPNEGAMLPAPFVVSPRAAPPPAAAAAATARFTPRPPSNEPASKKSVRLRRHQRTQHKEDIAARVGSLDISKYFKLYAVEHDVRVPLCVEKAQIPQHMLRRRSSISGRTSPLKEAQLHSVTPGSPMTLPKK